jgi:tetratricopeptide (TPR) repeat protein
VEREAGRKLADVPVWADLADLALQSGDQAAARGYLEHAVALPGAAPDLARIARTYQRLQEYPLALRLWDRLIAENPPRAQWLNDRGVLQALMGRREQAVIDLRSAIAQDRSFLPAYLSLGALYAAQGERGQARRLYAQALAGASASASPRLLQMLRRQRDSLEP